MIVHTWFKRFATVTLLALVGSLLLAQGAKASPEDTVWGATEVRSKNGSLAAVYSAIDYDGNGKIHIAWFEYGPTDGDLSRVLYTNNVNGSWLTPFEVSNSAGRGAEPLLSLVVENSGARVHFLYVTSSSQVAHRYLTLTSGTPTKSPVTVLSNNKGANPNLTIDTLGRINALWITRAGDTAPYQVYHRIWTPNGTTGAWESGSRVVRADGILQKFPKGAVTNDGRLHAVFLSNGRFRYSIFNGSAWAPATDIPASSPKQIGIATDGGTVFVFYSAQPGNYHNVYITQGNGTAWTSPVLLSTGSSYDEMPDPFYSPGNNTVYLLWASGSSPQTTKTVVREYQLGGGFTNVLNFGGDTTQYPHGAASTTQVSAIWQDKITNIYDIRHKIANLNGVPEPTATPSPTNTPVPSVDFTLAVGAGSGGNVSVALSNFSGSPDKMRVSATPFTPDAPSSGSGIIIPWQTLDSVFDYPSTPNANCQAPVYVQLQNSTNGMVSMVKGDTGQIDTAVQGVAIIRTQMAAGTLRAPQVSQPNAPAPPSVNYTRDDKFFYDITQEPTGCSLIKKHNAGGVEFNPASYPVNDQQSSFAGLNNGADTNGVGIIEQTVQATVRLTDTAGNSQSFARTINIDDDPPVLGAGGMITFTDGMTSSSSLVDITVTATVTDDGYLDPSAPADKKYWGMWVVATNNSTLPTPAIFAQYGRLVALPGGATTATVQVTNASTGMSGEGMRYIHVRFVDGAGNYTEAGITSGQLNLLTGFTQRHDYLPLLVR